MNYILLKLNGHFNNHNQNYMNFDKRLSKFFYSIGKETIVGWSNTTTASIDDMVFLMLKISTPNINLIIITRHFNNQ